MKTNFFYSVLLIIALSSCTKENPKMSPGEAKIIPFDVTSSVAEVKVGELVVFQFEGNADTVYFWSGEFGMDYNYKEGRVVPIENPTLRISTGSSYGEQESLSILLSHDFDGEYTYASITNATWKDMTPKFNIPTPAGGTAIRFTSNPIDISEFIEGDQPYYLAVRNNIETSSEGNRPTQWYFYGTGNTDYPGWLFTGSLRGTSTEIAAFAEANWKVVVDGYLGGELDGTRGPRTTPNNSTTPTAIFLARNSASAEAIDAWAVTKAFSSNANIGGDKGQLIKRISELPLTEYRYLYTEPGEYDVTFETINQDRTKKVVQLKITVLPND